MNSSFAAIITSVVIGVIFALSQRKAKKLEAEMDAGDFIVRRPLVLLIIGLILTIIFVFILAVLNYKDPDIWLVLLIFLPFLLLGPMCVVCYYRWNIIVKGNQISYTPLFGKERTFSFDHITTVKRGALPTRGESVDTIKAYHGKKKLFTVTDVCPGFNVLASRLESEGVPIIGMGLKDKLFG